MTQPLALLTTGEAAEYLRVSRCTLWRMVRARQIRQTRGRGRRPTYSRQELERYVRDNTRFAK
jgi:excisionase family DNA binding protein